MYAQPGKKLLFMGGEIGQWTEWNHDSSVEWHLLDYPNHESLRRWVDELNWLYKREPALHELDLESGGFEWIDANDAENNVLSFIRKGRTTQDIILVLCNFTPVPRHSYRVGAPRGGFWREILNSDAREYGGSGQGNLGGVEAVPVPLHGRPRSLTVTVPPLGVVFFKSEA
jgi:1,4-alpha-glucan branching enzyme